MLLNSPLIPMTGMWGKRRRTTESSSNPFMFGIRKSEIRMSGGDLRNSTRAAKPSAAVLTSKPLLSKILAEVKRITSHNWRSFRATSELHMLADPGLKASALSPLRLSQLWQGRCRAFCVETTSRIAKSGDHSAIITARASPRAPAPRLYKAQRTILKTIR